jgi:oxygen-independent coproporphyrinogen-3 oxidase
VDEPQPVIKLVGVLSTSAAGPVITINEGSTVDMQMMRGTMKELDPDTAASMFDYTRQRMETAGLPPYEVSNHAAPGQESRHNLVYWRYGDYVGIGPGAHGRLTVDGEKFATETAKSPEAWLEKVNTTGNGLSKWDPIAPREQATERLLMGLRLSEGVEMAMFSGPGDVISPPGLARLEAGGFLKTQQGRLMATPQGRLVLNAVLRDLLV